MITSATPLTWQDLQEETAGILRDCGFEVEVEKRVRTVRGEVVIDVFAEEMVKGRKYVLLCECKHWKSRVPQSVIHSFRTTVGDIGANVGYVISTSGFQAGAFAASELTNLQLTNWSQFQTAFEQTWLQEHFMGSLSQRLDALLSYCEPLLPAWFRDLPGADQDAFIALKEKHDALSYLVMLLTPYVRVFSKEPLPELSLRETFRDKADFLQHLPADVVEATGYKQLFDHLVRHGDAAIAEFRAIRDRLKSP